MNILMRADANPNIGQGHVMRLLSVADAFTEIGVKSAFVCAKDSFTDLISKRGYEVYTLKTGYREMEMEEEELKGVIDSQKAGFIIVDSYFVTAKYLEDLKQVLPVIYFDDVFEFPYPVDLLVNYNIYGTLDKYQALYQDSDNPKPAFILGPEYAPLRREFQNIPERIQPEVVKNIAVSFGGADPERMAKAFLDTLKDRESAVKKCKVNMILGAMEPDLKAIEAFSEETDWLTLHVNISDMKGVLTGCDLAVSAAGSTQYEICACQVPCINFSMADNQVPGGEEFGRRGIFHYVGDKRFESDFYGKLISAMEDLISDYDERVRMGKAERALTDGLGAKRMAGKILEVLQKKSSRERKVTKI